MGEQEEPVVEHERWCTDHAHPNTWYCPAPDGWVAADALPAVKEKPKED